MPDPAGLPFPPEVNDQILVLLDIDGTLLDAAGQGRGAFHDALEQLFPGVEFPRLSMAGRTDKGLWIQLSGLVPEGVLPTFEDFVGIYAPLLEGRLETHPPRALPGAKELLDALEREAEFQPGIATGNILEGTRAKLLHCGMWAIFERTGVAPAAFGDADPDKGPLARKALGAWGRTARAILVGDTPEDVRCAHQADIPCLAVATGGFTAEVLLGHGADAFIADLSDTAEVLRELRRLARIPKRIAA